MLLSSMDEGQILNNGRRAEPRFLGPRVVTANWQETRDMHPVVLGVVASGTIIGRDTTSSGSSSSTTCAANDNSSICEKPVQQSTFTLPIALGVAIPLVGALVVFFFLHRRHVRKMKQEDANDPHKSLDFGLGEAGSRRKNGAGGADIDLEEKPIGRHALQRSMDMNMVSPYLLPPELQNSRESLHSLSRTIHQQEDPYRPVSQFLTEDAHSLRSVSRLRGDGASVYTASSGAPSRLQETSAADLLGNAAPMSRTGAFVPPPRQNSLPKSPIGNGQINNQNNPLPQLPGGSAPSSPADQPQTQIPPPMVSNIQRKGVAGGLPSNPRPGADRGLSPEAAKDERESYIGKDGAALRNSNNYLASFINASQSSPPTTVPTVPAKSERSLIQEAEPKQEEAARDSPAINTLPANPRPPRNQSLQSNQAPQLPQLPEPQEAWIEDGSDYGDGFQVTPPSPRHQDMMRGQRYSMDVPPEEFAQAGLGAPGFDPRRISMGFRPLPPDNAIEHDDPEVRANRIRSFYKEYFDESKPAPQGQYYEDYDQNYLGDAAYYDPDSNNFVMPYAEPVLRRAMTPPPQSQRFMGQPPRAFHGSMGGYGGPPGPYGAPVGGFGGRGMTPPGPRPGSSASARRPPPGPRSYSSASGRMGPPGAPRGRPMPPPAALNTLPTPSKLRDDSFALMNSIDFAPPVSYKERQAGRSQSPIGERRPYSPAVPVYKPLASTYDELPSMPSPHLLRKSGTFTGLDFAPPRRIKDPDTMSDSGSIRSNRSGVSAVQQNAIRNGAYRVSRLPGDMVFTRDDMMSALKPSWKVGS